MSDELPRRIEDGPADRVGPPVPSGRDGHAATADLRALSRAQLDALYRASTPGPVPTGRTRGTALLLPGSRVDRVVGFLVGALAWRGKVFDAGHGELKNLVTPLGLPAVRARVYEGESWFDEGGRALVLDYSETSLVARRIRDEIRQVAPGVWLGHAYWGGAHVLRFMLEAPPAREA